MATSSITKSFVVKDKKAYLTLIEDLNKIKIPVRLTKPSSIEKGKEMLKQFSFK